MYGPAYIIDYIIHKGRFRIFLFKKISVNAVCVNTADPVNYHNVIFYIKSIYIYFPRSKQVVSQEVRATADVNISFCINSYFS